MVPVTIVTGSLGAGKTTLINHLLSSQPDRRIGVLVNDFGEVNIDSRLIAGATGDVVSLTNGCICCSMKNDVVQAVVRVLEDPSAPEHLLVEASGVSNPGALAEIFLGLEKNRLLRVDGIVAVIDAERFPFESLKSEPLARDQVLASDVVVLNKIDLIEEDRADAIEAAIRARIAGARILRARSARVPAELLLGLGAARREMHHHDQQEHEYQSFVFRGGTLVFKRLADVIRDFPATVVRIKGIISVEERPGDRLALNVVGKRIHVETIGRQEQPSSEIVVIGSRFEEGALATQLRSCEV